MNTEIDKVLQAERKLQGLCPLCGSIKEDNGDIDHPYTSFCAYGETESYRHIPDSCLDSKVHKEVWDERELTIGNMP